MKRRARWLCGGLLIALTVTVGARQDRPAANQTGLDNFIAAFLAEPKHAGDMSPVAFADDLARTRAQLTELRAMDGSRLSPDEALDRRFVEALLARRRIEQERMRRWRMDPRVYSRSLDEIAARLDETAAVTDDDDRAAAILVLLKAVPQDLRFGRRNLTLNVARFQERALSRASAQLTTLDSGIETLAGSVPDQEDALLAAATAATEALNGWIDYLAKELPKRPTGYEAVGIETYNAILREALLLPYDADELYQFAQSEFERTQGQLKDLASQIDETRPWTAVANEVEVDDLDADALSALYQEASRAARESLAPPALGSMPWSGAHDALAAWQMTPDASAADLFGKPDPAVVRIQAQASYANRIREIYQQHNASSLRRGRSVSTFTEGWPLYVEHVIEEKSLLGDDPGSHALLRLLQLRLLAITRAAVDIGLHTHKLTDAEALGLLTDRVGLTKAAAERLIAQSADDPGSGLGYMGTSEILRLRDEFQKARGDAFSLEDFHERLLRAGPMPIALVRAALLR